jgi:hypothetical protein
VVEPTGVDRRTPGQAVPNPPAPDEGTGPAASSGAGGPAGRTTDAPAPLGDRHVALLRALAREPMRERRGAAPRELDELVARGLAASTFVGHAGIELTITEAGTRALAELDAPPPASVYEVPEVREELGAFLDAWLAAVGQERTQPFKANLAYLLDLAVARALDLERAQLRRELAAWAGADGPEGQTVEAALAALLELPPGALRGRSSRAGGPRA